MSLFADELSAGARATLLSARKEVDRMSRTVADLLTLAAVDEGMFAMVARPTELDGVAASVADALRPWAHRRHVRLELEATPPPSSRTASSSPAPCATWSRTRSA